MERQSRFRIGAIVLVLALGQVPLRASTNYVSLSGNHVWPFTNWVDAATNIQAAVNAASGGDIVIVAEGSYRLHSEITVATNITVQSDAGPSVTMIDGGRTTRCFRVADNAGSVGERGQGGEGSVFNN